MAIFDVKMETLSNLSASQQKNSSSVPLYVVAGKELDFRTTFDFEIICEEFFIQISEMYTSELELSCLEREKKEREKIYIWQTNSIRQPLDVAVNEQEKLNYVKHCHRHSQERKTHRNWLQGQIENILEKGPRPKGIACLPNIAKIPIKIL